MKGGRNYLICRQVSRTLRGSVVTEINKVISSWGVGGLFQVNKTDGTITCHNGYQIVFIGLDDVEKIKSITPAKGVFTDIWIEEATETDERTVKQLYKRQRGGSANVPKRMVLSFNPILQLHWIYKRWFALTNWKPSVRQPDGSYSVGQTEYQGKKFCILKTTYKDNKFLTAEDIEDLENEDDRYHYEVYTLGNWGILGNVVFTNWEVRDLSGLGNQFTARRHGLDFGFGSSPAAANSSHYDRSHKTIYVYKELHEYGLTNDELANKIDNMIGKEKIVADSAEPKSIKELRQHGVNAVGAVKGKDSIDFGVQWLQQHHIVIDEKCVYTVTEFQMCHRKEDKMGNVLDEIADEFNHHIDGLRYAFEEDALSTKVRTNSATITNYISGPMDDSRPPF
jgi:phage terminase large subunit